MISLKNSSEELSKQVNEWAISHVPHLVLFNILLIVVFLLRSVGYFSPFFPLTNNFIIFFATILSVLLLGARSRIFFMGACIFWVIAFLFKIAKVDVWAERTSVYVFEFLVVGIVLLVIDNFKRKRTE